jgi:hypothetical protein
MITNETITAIQGAVAAEFFEHDGTMYSSKKLYEITPEDPSQLPSQAAMKSFTLQSIVDYVKTHGITPAAGVVAHVLDHSKVELVTLPAGHYKQRDLFLTAISEWPVGLKFGSWLDNETFMIQLQALYLETDERDRAAKLIGNIRTEASVGTEDDGVTQRIEAKTGVARVSTVDVTNPFTLAPFRTFREISQPESPFILRVRQGGDAALFEADGGSWKLTAIQRIRDWLVAELPETFPVIA